MTLPALWTKHRPIALAIATEYHIPGMDPDDVRQEALIALWEACRAYDRERGRFPAFARIVVRRRLTDLLRAETSAKNYGITLERDLDVPARDEADGREQLQLVLDVDLTPRERRAVADHLNGQRSRVSKAHDQALYRARRKLKAAA